VIDTNCYITDFAQIVRFV